MQNPVIQQMMERFFTDKFQQMQKDNNSNTQKGNVLDNGNKNKMIRDNSEKRKERSEVIKSPSDTTIYAPELQKKLTLLGLVGLGISEAGAPQDGRLGVGYRNDLNVLDICEHDGRLGVSYRNDLNVLDICEHDPSHSLTLGTEEITKNQKVSQGIVHNNNLVSQFVEAVRLEGHPEDGPQRRKSDVAAIELEQAQQRAEKAVLEAEKFRASVETPGKFLNNNVTHGIPSPQLSNLNADCRTSMNNIPNIGGGVSDDDFFHLTCHIEPSLIHKIVKGEFIELEKLLPKDKVGKGKEGRMEWVHRDGGTFLVPAQRDSKIGSFRRWEQAFRVYATI